MSSDESRDDIAIVGMACRVAGADSPSQLWDSLVARKDAQSEISRFNIDGYYKPSGGPRKGLTNVRHAYFMDGGVDRFDHEFFSITRQEATAMDPQQRLLLEIAYETFESAGIPLEKIQGTETGVYTGLFTNDYGTSLLRDIDGTPKYHSTGASNSIAANRISYFFDLHGPSMVVDTACSSTVVALHLALASLKAGESEMALVCGANLIINPDMFVHMSELGFLSPRGRCHSFDASGDGYARGEGVLALLLKPLRHAIRDNDPIRAVLRGTRVNQDGRTNGITLPSGEAQRRNMDTFYKSLDISPGEVQYFEAHGTGTAAGDPIEVSAINSVFAESHKTQKLVVGSVKTNVGHLEACAAIVGIIKAVECLERGQIPPQMHFNNPNPKINYESIVIPTELMQWPETSSKVRRAAVNSFGFGGTNGHLVLENFPIGSKPKGSTDRPFLFKLSATNEQALQRNARSILDYIERRNPPLQDLAHTLLSRRSTLKKSTFVAASTKEELVEKLTTFIDEPKPILTTRASPVSKIGFVFTGQGAQWAEMGKTLLTTSPIFSAVIDECDSILASLPDQPDWKIREELQRPGKASRINISSFSQPICTALQLGLVEIWREWGITPHAVFGHSSGEIAAAYTAGLISLRSAIIAAYYRGLYMGSSSSKKDGPNGAMCAVGMGATEARKAVDGYSGRIALAAINSPSSCTLSGDEDAIDEIVEACKGNGTFCRKLRVDMAYHSHHMLPLAPLYREALQKAQVAPIGESIENKPEMFSSVIGQKMSSLDCDPDYWAKNMTSTVRFTDALSAAIEHHELDALVEVGPHPALKGPVMDSLAAVGKTEVLYLGSCERGKDDINKLLGTLGEMITSSFPVMTRRVNASISVDRLAATYEYGRIITDLPTYSWDHSVSHWAETRVSKKQRFREFPRHQLLGARTIHDTPLNMTWRNVLMLSEVDWLSSLAGQGWKSVPPSVFLLMAFEAARQVKLSSDGNLLGLDTLLQNVNFRNPIPMTTLTEENGKLETQFHLQQLQANSHEFQFTIYTAVVQADEKWSECCSGVLKLTEATSERAADKVDHDQSHLEFIDSFNAYPALNLDEFQVNKAEASGSFDQPLNKEESYVLSPAVLASILQVPNMLMLGYGTPAIYEISTIKLIQLSQGHELSAGAFNASLSQAGPTQGTVDIDIYGAKNKLISISGLRAVLHEHITRDAPLNSLFYKPRYLPDIGHFNADKLSLAQCVELLTHKWPMIDIAIADVQGDDVQTLLSHMKGLKENERSRFRSLNLLKDAPGSSMVEESKRVRVAEKFSSEQRFHLFVCSMEKLPDYSLHIRPDGFVFAKVQNEEDTGSFLKSFDRVAEVQEFATGTWLLGRQKAASNGVPLPRPLRILAAEGVEVGFDLAAQGQVDTLSGDKANLANIQSTYSESQEPMDLIILDCGNDSMLETWAGEDLLPVLQAVIPRVNTLLWVSHQKEKTPYGAVPGTFVRTIQSEHPSMRVASLVFKDGYSPPDSEQFVADVYHDIMHGSKEVEHFVEDSRLCILRYLPDDELSASVGDIPALVTSSPLDSTKYYLTLTGPREVTLASQRFIGFPESSEDVQIAVETSVVDCDDVTQYCDLGSKDSNRGLGRFFSGTIVSSHPTLAQGTNAIGWASQNAHASEVNASVEHVLPIPHETSFSEASVRYAAVCSALAVLDGTARARHGDKLRSSLSGVLSRAIDLVANYFGVTNVLDAADESDFDLSFDVATGLVLNGKPVRIDSYMASGQWKKYSSLIFDQSFIVGDIVSSSVDGYRVLFEPAIADPCSAVVVHSSLKSTPQHLIQQSNPKRLFRNDAAYILIGGLGGLGRYLASWMVEKGARHLFFLSRSGMSSDAAKQTVADLEKLGAKTTVFEVDACNREAVSDALAQIRSELPIKGCFNMVLALENSPFMTMQPWQWNKALRTKVDSSWNLHLATLKDDLDLFIMFSSISSISGNRTQSNYATGNAFQNSLATYRQSLGLTGVAIAVGAMSGIGVLANDHDLLRNLRQSGLQSCDPKDLIKVVEAAIFESHYYDRPLISTGFEMFQKLDDVLQARSDQNQVFWADWPEFGFLIDHRFSDSGSAAPQSLIEQLRDSNGKDGFEILLQAFLECLGGILGYDISRLDPSSSLAQYGLDSLNAVALRYWFFKQIELDVPVFDILGCRSINELVSRTIEKLKDQDAANAKVEVPQPVHYAADSLEVRPISHSQSRLWFLQKFLPDKSVYNLLLVCHIDGTINVPLFRKAWSIFVRRHEILHSRIVDTEKGLQQLPLAEPSFPIIEAEVNSSESDFFEKEKAITETARTHVFDLEAGELVRGWLLSSPWGTRFFLTSHHLAWDRSSVPTIFHETTTIYKSLIASQEAEADLAPVPYQFIDYTLWQEEWLSKTDLVQPHLSYWTTQLDNIPDAVSVLPSARVSQRPVMKQYDVESTALGFDSSLSKSIKDFCKSAGVTPFMFMTFNVAALVHRFTGDRDIVIGIADGDRGHTEFDKLVGFTVNMLPIRCQIEEGSSYTQLLEKCRETCLGAYEHRSVPFDYLLQRLNVPRRTAHSPLFQITVNYQTQGSFPICDYGDFKFVEYDHYNARSQSDFGVEIEETPEGGLEVVFSYDTALYDLPAMTDLAKAFKTMISDVIETKGLVGVEKLNIVPTDDLNFMAQVLQPEFPGRPSLESLDQDLFPSLLAKAVASFPSKPALVDGDSTLTYSEMDTLTNRIANGLIAAGHEVGDRIGVCCEQSVEMVLAMFGILKAGCVYVPIDPDFPAERMTSMIDDVELESVIMDKARDNLTERLVTAGIVPSSIYIVGSLTENSELSGPPSLSRPVNISDAFCCIFTSGSTGRPKGIYLGHRQLRHQMQGYHDFLGTTSDDRLLLSSAMVFDMSLPPIYGTILHGGTMIIASREARYSPVKMIELCIAEGVSSCTFTTTQLKLLLTAQNKSRLNEWKSLNTMVVGGERIPSWVVRDFYALGLPRAFMVNGYAPSETTVCNSMYRVQADDAQKTETPLGPPLFPSKFYILDEHLQPVPIGSQGELYIGGTTVNQGYIKREDITATAFLPNPFDSTEDNTTGSTVFYRTGDNFRLLHDGTIQALGRIGGDRQVKIRGMRTELDEVENVVYDAIKEIDGCSITLAAVVYHRTDDFNGVLALYLAASNIDEVPAAQTQAWKEYIRLKVKATLPLHMLPSAFIFMKSLPQMVSGKTDYKTILTWSAPAAETMVAGGQADKLDLSPVQSTIAAIWKEILHFEGDLTAMDEFFQLGGHSLALLQVHDMIQERFNITLNLGDMFVDPTVSGMEALVLAQGIVDGLTTELGNTAANKPLREEEEFVDWKKEASLPPNFDWFAPLPRSQPLSAIAITGACTMAGVHFIQHVLSVSPHIQIYCIGTEGNSDDEARSKVLQSLDQWNLSKDIAPGALDQLIVYSGSLAHPQLGLSDEKINLLDEKIQSIYQLDSDVSLLKSYANLRASNVGSLEFLVSLAHGKIGNTKAIHYLSTWGVPHLQAWTKTELTSPTWLTAETEMSNMLPGADGTLGYLKARWACEAMLYHAARRGIPVSIYRSCMCGSSPSSGVPLARTDINRRILEGSLQTGLVPDFSSARGGGMSWITADFLVQSMFYLSQRHQPSKSEASIHHVVSDVHIPYTELPQLLDVSHSGEKLRVATPEEWFSALRETGNPEMRMQAEVLEHWCKAGWVPFGLDAKQTLGVLQGEKDLSPPKVDRDLLLKLVVGDQGF